MIKLYWRENYLQSNRNSNEFFVYSDGSFGYVAAKAAIALVSNELVEYFSKTMLYVSKVQTSESECYLQIAKESYHLFFRKL